MCANRADCSVGRAKEESSGGHDATMQGRLRILFLMLADVLCLACAWAAAFAGCRWFGAGACTFSTYAMCWPVVVLFIASNTMARLYHGNPVYPSLPFDPVEEFRRLVVSSAVVHLAVLAFFGFSSRREDVSPLVFGIACLLTMVFAQSFRNVVRRTLKRLGIGELPFFLVGSGALARQIARECSTSPFLGCRIVGSFDDQNGELPGIPRLGGLRDIVEKGREMGIKRLIACYDERQLENQLSDFVRHFQYINFFPTRKTFPLYGSRIVAAGGLGGIELMNQSCMKALRWEKSALDFLLAVLAFVLCLPFFVVIPVLIKLTSPGPVFYRHRRLGRNGREMWIWKFRSMYADADARLANLLASDPAARDEWTRKFKLRHDPRITPFGRILRKTSLDEIPQLFNVLAGEMAMVGPRPIVADEIEYYGENFRLFSRVKPGVTGLWQVSGRSETDYARRVSLDSYYVLNWTPWMDLWILLRTVASVVLMRGAC